MSPASRVVETVFPQRLGTSFRWLVASSWTTNLGDGLMMAAGPLLVASQTRNPVLVAAAAMAFQLPWLVFGLVAGAMADRLDRRVLVMAMDAARAIVLAGLCAVILTGHVNIWLVMGAMFLVGLAEVFADSATGTLLPMLVDKPDLGIANARIQVGFLTANQLVGPALGAVIFAAGMALPFMIQTVCVALGVVLVSRIGTPRGAVREHVETHVRQDIAEGVRWLAGNKPVRTLALVIVAFNITWAAPWSVLVLWSLERVGHGRGRLRPAHHRVGARRAAGDGGVRAGREAGAAGHPDAHGAGVRGGLPPRDGADDLAVGGVPADVLLRRLRLHLGHAVAGGPAAGGAHGVPGPGRARSTCCASWAACSAARCSAG